MNDLHIYQEIMDDVSAMRGSSEPHSTRYERYPYPQRLAILSDVLKLHTLRERGDINRYLELQQEIFDLDPARIRKKDKALFSMMQWLNHQIASITPVTSEKGVFVITMAVWGAEYTQRMLDFNFKSMMARENLPSIAVDKRIIIYIQTDINGMVLIESADIVKQMKAIGVHFEYTLIPEELIWKVIGDTEMAYWMLGAAATLGIHYAKTLHAAYHHSYPDVIYSNKFFSEVLRLSKEHRAVLAPGFRSDEEMLKPLLKVYNNDVLSVPSADLMALHLNCIHAVAWPYMVNNRNSIWSYPLSHVMMWESEEALHISSPHLNILWLDYEMIKDLESRFYMTLDSEMDFICKEEDYYIPREQDEIYMPELSSPDRASMLDCYDNAMNVSYLIWDRIKRRDVLKFFIRGYRVKINRNIRPVPDNVILNAQGVAERKYLYNTLLSTDPYARSMKRTHVGKVF